MHEYTERHLRYGGYNISPFVEKASPTVRWIQQYSLFCHKHPINKIQNDHVHKLIIVGYRLRTMFVCLWCNMIHFRKQLHLLKQ